MPNVSVFIPAPHMPHDAELDQFTSECTELCTGILKAALDKVHIIFVPVLAKGRGQGAYVEIKYRMETFRPAEVMDDFMARLDTLTKGRFGCTTRIRCFGYAPGLIYGLN